jgi:hypothetical protein
VLSADAKTTPDIVAAAKPAVLKLLTFDSQNKLTRTGTAFFVSADGMAITSLHVVQGADHVIGQASNGATYTSIGSRLVDRNSDLAVLQFTATEQPHLELADGSSYAEGDKVIVIGAPEGLQGTVSDGIISAIKKPDGEIQFTAPVSPGSSGSPVLNEKGNVIGVVTAQFKEGQNLNFATAGRHVIELLKSCVGTATVTPFRQNSSSEEKQSPTSVNENGWATIYNGAYHLRHKNLGPALRLLRQATTLYPGNVSAWILFARALSAAGQKEEAFEAQLKVVQLDPDSSENWDALFSYSMALPNAFTAADGFPQRKAIGERAIGLGSKDVWTWGSLTLLLNQFHDPEATRRQQEFDQLQKTHQTSMFSLYNWVTTRPFAVRGAEQPQLFTPIRDIALYFGMDYREENGSIILSAPQHTVVLQPDAFVGWSIQSDGVTYRHIFLEDIGGEKHVQMNDLDWVFVPLLDPGLLSKKPRLDYCYVSSDDPQGDSEKLIQALFRERPYLFTYPPPGPILSRDAFVLKIKIIPSGKGNSEIPSALYCSFSMGTDPKGAEQIREANLACERSLVLKEA